MIMEKHSSKKRNNLLSQRFSHEQFSEELFSELRTRRKEIK
jgi:hypothetical protein